MSDEAIKILEEYRDEIIKYCKPSDAMNDYIKSILPYKQEKHIIGPCPNPYPCEEINPKATEELYKELQRLMRLPIPFTKHT